MDLREVLSATGTLGVGASLVAGVGFMVKRYLERNDKHEEQVTKAYRKVLKFIASYRGEMDLLKVLADPNQEQHHEDYAATNISHEMAVKLIEENRPDTGSEFAEAAKAVIAYWDHESSLLWMRDYETFIPAPSIEDRLARLEAAVPKRYRKRANPGSLNI